MFHDAILSDFSTAIISYFAKSFLQKHLCYSILQGSYKLMLVLCIISPVVKQISLSIKKNIMQSSLDKCLNRLNCSFGPKSLFSLNYLKFFSDHIDFFFVNLLVILNFVSLVLHCFSLLFNYLFYFCKHL